MEKQSVRVNIWGIEYALKSESEPQYIEDLANYVDQKMRKLGEGSANKSQVKIAVLTALNIADELFRLKRKYEKLISDIESTSEEITENLDHYLNHYSNLLK
jgi:cell division protein ZapA